MAKKATNHQILTIADIEALDKLERKVLELYALAYGEDSDSYQEDLKNELKVTRTRIDAALKFLDSGGAMYKYGYSYYRIRQSIVVAVLVNMALRHPQDADPLKKIIQEKHRRYWRSREVDFSLYDCVMYAVGILKTRPEDKINDRYINAVLDSYRLKTFPKLISFFDSGSIAYGLSELFGFFLDEDTVLSDDILDNISVDECGDNLLSFHVSDIKSMYRFFLDGTYEPADLQKARPFRNILTGIYHATRGEYSYAMTFFSEALKVLNKERAVKNIFYDFLPSYFYILTLAHIGTEAAVTKLKQFLKKKDVHEMSDQSLPVAIATAFTSADRMPSKSFLSRAISNLQYGNISFLAKMTAKYFGVAFNTSDTSTWCVNKANFPAFKIMQHEASAYLKLDDNEREELERLYGNQPMLTSIHRKQEWEWVIEDVERNINANATPNASSKQSSERLIYIITGRTVEPKIQSWLKSGRWSMPKNVSRKRLEEGDVPNNEEYDRKFAALVREINYNNYWTEWPSVNEALPVLAGCDRLLDSDGYNYKPVVVDEEDLYIKFGKANNGSITVSSNVTLTDLDNIYNDRVLTSSNKGKYTVVKVEPEKTFILKRLLAQGSFPADAEEQVRRLLMRMEDVIEVRSPLIDSKAVPTVNGSLLMAARVTPVSGMGYDVDFEVHPLEGGSLHVFPGEGKAMLYDIADGKNVRVKRDLKAEVKTFKELVDDLGFIDPDNSENGFRYTLSVDDILDLMDYAEKNSGKLVIDWAEGKGLKLSHASQSTWNAGLKSANEWFEIEGDVKVNDKKVATMAQMLELISQSKGRYVRLSDTDYLEISTKLRRQLERIEALASKHRNKLVISTFNAALLDDKALDGELKVAFDKKLVELRKRIKDSADYEPEVPSTLQAQLRPYQEEGFKWMARLASWGGGSCLADDMGLGKTVETIAFLLLKAQDGPALVVAPASVVSNWINELGRFAPTLTPQVLNKAADRAKLLEDAGPYDVILSTYGILNTEEENLAKKQWATVCLDEAHIIKNKGTKMSQAAMALQATNRIILTGTPIQNHLGELWNLFRFINPGLLGSDEAFRHKYVLPIQDGDKDKQRALQRIIKPFMLRRTKNDVIDDLPEKTEIVLPVELSESEMSMYEAMRLKAANVINNTDKVDVNTLAEITRLRRAACSMRLVDDKWDGADSKVQAFLDLAGDFQGGGNRMLVFSQFTSFLAIVRDALDKAGIKYLYLDGSTSMKERERLVKEFKTGDIPIFIISLKAGGLGLNLPEANYVVHLDPWWNPAIEQQATDRAYRIGQKRNVTVYHLVAKNTIEEKIRRLHRTKRDLSDSLLEGTDMASKLDIKEILELVNA